MSQQTQSIRQWKLGSGQPVFDRSVSNSHLHKSVLPVLAEALARIYLSRENFVKQQVDFDRVVGQNMCVVTGPNDQIVYAQRSGRIGKTRFVRNRKPEPCKSVVVILKKADEGKHYILITTFIGEDPQPEPWDCNATPSAKVFWANHALIYDPTVIIKGTETSKCPW